MSALCFPLSSIHSRRRCASAGSDNKHSWKNDTTRATCAGEAEHGGEEQHIREAGEVDTATGMGIGTGTTLEHQIGDVLGGSM